MCGKQPMQQQQILKRPPLREQEPRNERRAPEKNRARYANARSWARSNESTTPDLSSYGFDSRRGRSAPHPQPSPFPQEAGGRPSCPQLPPLPQRRVKMVPGPSPQAAPPPPAGPGPTPPHLRP